jgi:REP element-mobilizing transposase RayT
MANTYTQLFVQIIFAVKGRNNLISDTHRDELEKYICGIISDTKSKMLALYCNPDHMHIFLGIHPSDSVSDTVMKIKANSSRFINEKKWMAGLFYWQEGYGAFTYSKSQVNSVIKYVLNQKEHHKKKTFKEEYVEFLKEYDVQYNEQYLFEDSN